MTKTPKRPAKVGFLKLKGETFPYDTLVCLGGTRDQLISYIEKEFENRLSDDEKNSLQCSGNGRAFRVDDGGWYILWLKKYPEAAEQMGHLAHEIFHVADLMLRKAGATLSDDSDEVWAYHIDWFTRRIYAAFKLL